MSPCQRFLTNQFVFNCYGLQHLGLSFYRRKHASIKQFDFYFNSVNYKPDPLGKKSTSPPNLWGSEHITPQPMKMDFLPLELFKTGQITPSNSFEKS
jgi:hypothetical protein